LTISKLAIAGALALAACAAAVVGGRGIASAHSPGGPSLGHPITPIKHVIVIIGENHTFDNVFGTYEPPKGHKVHNLLSEGIVTASGGPGANVSQAVQNTASDKAADGYQINPKRTGPYSTLPAPNTTYVSKACDGLNSGAPDTRFPQNLSNAPYQITKSVPYFDGHGAYNQYGTCEFNGAYVGDPLHRFYQMYQEVSNGKSDLFTWVHETAGDSNGNPPPNPFTYQSTGQGALDMGFYNMATGDAPTF
jgi:phospholipase C